MGGWRDLFEALFPEGSPEDRARSLRVLFRIIVGIHIIWACGVLAPLGLSGFVQADEVDDKIEKAVQPLNTQLSSIKSTLTDQEAVLRSIRIDQLAAKLRELKRSYCLAGSDVLAVERLENEIERAQLEYSTLTGQRYPLNPCVRSQ